jgi:hypothetical protein
MSEMLEAALSLAERSFYVFPLTPKSKIPLPGSRGFKDASLNFSRIRTLWAPSPLSNVGVSTGPSRLIVLDVDAKRDGLESWHRLSRDLDLKIDTLTSLTGGGGLHVFYRAGDFSVPSAANFAGEDYPGLDIRARGGYIVAPPSVHESGKRYEWDAYTDAIATIPEALEVFIRDTLGRERGGNPIAGRAMIPVGARNVSLTKIAGKLRFIGMEADEVFESLRLINRTRILDPLPERDLRTIVSSVFRYNAHPKTESLVDVQVAQQLIVISAFNIRVKRTEWLLDGFIPSGEVTIFEGRGGVGKSTCALDILARYSSGVALPGNAHPHPASPVLVFGDEDTHSTIKARLQAAKADLQKVFIVDGVGIGDDKRRFQLPSDLRLLEDAIVGYGARLVYLDSLFNAFAQGFSQNDALDVRRVVGGLADVAHRTGATIIATRHWGKGDKHVKDKGLGSVEITDVVRSVVAFDEDPVLKRVMRVTKHNYGKEAEPLGYDFESVTSSDDFGNPVEVARIQWSFEPGGIMSYARSIGFSEE